MRIFRALACWVVIPAVVGSVAYAELWVRYDQQQAAGRTLPAPVAGQFALLPGPVSTLVAVAFAGAGRQATDLVRVRVEQQVLGAPAAALRIRATAGGAGRLLVSYRAANGRDGCAALRLGSRPALGVAYAASRMLACRSASERMEITG